MKDSAGLLSAYRGTVLVVALLSGLGIRVAAAPAGEPRIDGLFDEWGEGSTVVVDEVGDSTAAFDLVRVAVRTQGTQVYLHFEIGQELNLQAGRGDEGTLRLTVELPDQRILSIDFRDRFACWTDRPDERIPWTAIKFACLPTFAAKAYELRLDLASLGVSRGDSIKIQFAGSDSLPEPLCVAVGDPPAPSGVMPKLGKAGDVRIANLNTLYEGLSHPQRSAQIRRLLSSVAADICCFQEELSEDLFRTAAPRVVPRKGGAELNLHWQGDCGIATCLPLQPLPMQFEMRFSRTDAEDRETGAAAAIQLPDGQYVVVCAVHLSCCGFRNDVRDQSRVHEVQRLVSQIDRLRAGEFGAHLRNAAVVVVGDYNLVGSRQPLATLESAGLAECLLYGLVDRSACTWRGDEDESYWPGRLDLMTYDSKTLESKAGFVLNTEDLSESLLSEHGLRRDDSLASDHLLLVADFVMRKK
ncbi:MAG: endonuclease/exonuclease/phosphatase family protein [Pirellulaceae bacterium]